MINIMFAGNYKVYDGLLIASLSILKNCKEPIRLFIMTMDLTDKNSEYKPIPMDSIDYLNQLYKQTNPESEVTLIDITQQYKDEFANAPKQDTQYTPYTLLRLFADQIDILPDKLLYLDTDVVAKGNIAELYNVDVSNYEIAGVQDYYGKWFFNKEYLNAGVLLLNMKEIRKTNMLHKALTLCATKKIFLQDQTAINKFAERKLILPRKFNEQNKIQEDTIIRHFSMTLKFFPTFKKQNIKPWHIDKVHNVLNIHEFDDILEEYKKIKNLQNKEKKIMTINNEINEKGKEIPIFFATDNNYVPFLAVSIKSLLNNANKNYFYSINVLSTGVTTQNIEKIKMLETENSKITFVDLSDQVDPFKAQLDATLRDYYTMSIFYRLFIASLFPQYEKAIYLDCDIVVIGDISKMYNVDLGDNIFGACVDDVIGCCKEFQDYATYGVGVPYQQYFNSGVLLMNLNAYRENKIEEKFFYLLNKYNFETAAPDQDYLNVLAKGKVKFLSKGWDKMSLDENYDGEVNLIHYNNFRKPWLYDNVAYSRYFWDYAVKTNFIHDIIKLQQNFTEQMAQKHLDGADALVQTTKRIIDSENNFYKVMSKENY